MVNHFINQFKTDITSIDWIERYGGLVRPITRVKGLKDGSTQVQRYPVSCEVSGTTCFDQGRYHDLVPDERYKSLTYWEQTSQVSMKPVAKMPDAYDMYEFSAPVQLVVWLNFPKLGHSACINEHLFSGHMFRILSKASRKHFQTPYKIEEVSFIPTGILENKAKIFQGYTYEDRQELMMFPFGAFAIKYNLVWKAFINCLPVVTLNEPIPCIDLTT